MRTSPQVLHPIDPIRVFGDYHLVRVARKHVPAHPKRWTHDDHLILDAEKAMLREWAAEHGIELGKNARLELKTDLATGEPRWQAHIQNYAQAVMFWMRFSGGA